MSGLLFLTSEDFLVKRGVKGNELVHSIPGFSFILFYSVHCQYCQNFIPVFKKLPGTIAGCQFGMLNVTNNKQLIELSKNTITPIKYVPYMVLYVNSIPYMEYQGPADINNIRNFIIEVANNIEKKQSFTKQNVKIENSNNNEIPAYCIGRPICSGNVCYLDFNKAYTPINNVK
jgi:hypothetical protein